MTLLLLQFLACGPEPDDLDGDGVPAPKDCDDTDDTVWSGCMEPTFTQAYDVVVVGSGRAGIAAALDAFGRDGSLIGEVEPSMDCVAGLRHCCLPGHPRNRSKHRDIPPSRPLR